MNIPLLLVKKQPLPLVFTMVLWFVVPSKTYAQNVDSAPVKYAVQAAQYCQQAQYDKAIESINKAIVSENEKEALYTWYVKGFVHKEIYKNKEATHPNSLHRELAVQAFLKSKSLTEGQADVYNNNSVLKYLASTYYNDALTIAGAFDLQNELEADTMMAKHDALCAAINEESIDKGNFFKQKAMRYFDLWQKDICNISLNEKSFACYELALDKHANDCDTYYNAGIVRYSLAQKMISDTACYIHHDYVSVLESALEVLTAGEQSCPRHAGILKALYNSYIALGDKEKTLYYEALLSH